MTIELIKSLKRSPFIKVRRFKNFDRIYWTTKQFKANANLSGHVEDIKDPDLKAEIMSRAEYLN
jgi:hypothetical protein